MPQEKTVAQELIDDNVETPPGNITLGGDEGDKPTIEGKSGETKQQEFEKELFEQETSQETSSTEEPKEEPKETEKGKTDAAFWQQQYQEFDAMVKKANPILRDTLNKELRAQRKGKEPDSLKTATEAARAEKIDVYENPEGFLNAMDERLEKFEKNIANRFQQNQDLAYQQASWEQEAQAAEQAVNQLKSNYRAELKLDDNTWKGIEDNAWQDVMEVLGLTDDNKNDFLGSLGGPSRVAKVLQKSLENRLLKHSYLTKVAEGRADVSGRIKAAAEVAQPTSQATPSPKTKSKVEKIIAAIEGAKGDQTAKDAIFGG